VEAEVAHLGTLLLGKPLSQFKVYAFPLPNAPTKIRAEIRAAAGHFRFVPVCNLAGSADRSSPDWTTSGQRGSPSHWRTRAFFGAGRGQDSGRMPGASACYPFATRPDFGVAAYANNYDGIGITCILEREMS